MSEQLGYARQASFFMFLCSEHGEGVEPGGHCEHVGGINTQILQAARYFLFGHSHLPHS